MPRPTLPDVYARLYTIDVLLTKHSKNDVWAHFESQFSTFDTRAEKYKNQMNKTIETFIANRPYDRINWRRNHTTGDARRNRVSTCLWNGYDEQAHDDYDKLRLLRDDLRLLKEEFGGKDDYAEYKQKADRFHEDMNELVAEYDRIEKYAWESSYARWKEEDADWIAETDAYKYHKNSHWTVEKQISNNNDWAQAFPSSAEKRKNFVPIDYTLVCHWCKEEAEKKKAEEERYRIFLEKQEADLKRQNEEWQMRQEAEKKAEEDRKREAWANAPVLTCETCKYSTKSAYSYDQHIDSKEHKNAVKMASLHCEKCNVYSRCHAEHQAHLHSKKHMGETTPEKKTLRCEICDYTAANKGNYDFHMNSKKHKKKAEDQTC